jgi:hypothetical protein
MEGREDHPLGYAGFAGFAGFAPKPLTYLAGACACVRTHIRTRGEFTRYRIKPGKPGKLGTTEGPSFPLLTEHASI